MFRSRFLVLSAMAACLVALAPLPARAAQTSLPAGFRAQSQDWISTTQAFVLGAAPCGRADCTTVVGTTDGGATWSTLGTMAAGLGYESRSDVTSIRFADAMHGWAFDPALWATSDGGVTWTRVVPPGGRPVVALEADADVAFAVVSACKFGQPISNCTQPTTLWRSTPGLRTWTQVSISLPVMNQAILAVHGLVGYLAVPAALIAPGSLSEALDVTVDGEHWSSLPDPCQPSQGEVLAGIAPVSDTKVALMCQANIGFGKAAKRVLRSGDNGHTTSPAGMLPLYGIVSQIAAAPNGTLVVSSYSIGSWIYRNSGGRTWTTSSDLGDGGMGWNDITLPTNQLGFVIHGPASCCGGHGDGQLWDSTDGGVTWLPA